MKNETASYSRIVAVAMRSQAKRAGNRCYSLLHASSVRYSYSCRYKPWLYCFLRMLFYMRERGEEKLVATAAWRTVVNLSLIRRYEDSGK